MKRTAHSKELDWATLARQLGGDVAVTSEPGQGSTFTVTVPVKREN